MTKKAQPNDVSATGRGNGEEKRHLVRGQGPCGMTKESVTRKGGHDRNEWRER